MFYFIAYLFMTLVAFYITAFVSDKYGNDHFERFSGLITRYPGMAIMMTIAMFSLTGMPPFAGFVSKFNILYAIIQKGFYTVAIIAVLNSVVSLYYYLKIVRLMVLKEPESTEKIEGFGFINQTIVTLLTAPILLLGVFWEKIILLAMGAKLFIQ